jgi:hypothetical protein
VVELADQADALGVWRPYRKGDPLDDPVGRPEAARMRTDDVPEPFMATLGEQVQVQLAEGGQESVGVGDSVWSGALVAHLQAVVDEVGERHRHCEQA